MAFADVMIEGAPHACFTKQALRPINSPRHSHGAGYSIFSPLRLGFSTTESAHHINDQADHQNEAQAAAAIAGAANIKTAATEQEK